MALLWTVRPAIAGDQAASSLVEIPIETSRIVSMAGVSQVVVVEESICRAELTAGGINFFALKRGETLVFAWIGEQRMDLLVRVVAPLPVPVRPSLSQEQIQRLGQGEVGTTAQVAIDPFGEKTYYVQSQFHWSQQADGRRLGVRTQARDSTSLETPWNLDTLSLEYATPKVVLNVVDFGLSLNGGQDARVTTYSPINSYVFRGANVSFTPGRTQFEAFAGTTLPSYYRSLQGTSTIAGVNVNRRQSTKLYLYSTTAWISVPRSGAGDVAGAREDSVFHTSGFAYQPTVRWAAQLTGGGSNRGMYGDGTLVFTADRLSASVTGATSSPEFPLNQLQLLSGGGDSVRTTTTWKATSRVSASLFYQHNSTRPSVLFPSFAGVSDYISPNINVVLTPSHSLSLNGVENRSRGGLVPGGATLVRSLDFGWTGQALGRISNSAQVSASRSEDPEQVNTGAGLSFRNSVSVRLKGGFVNLAFQRSRRDPSLATRLRQQIGLLPAHLQEAFLADPTGFVQSSTLPPEVRDLLGALRSEDEQLSVSGQFHLGRRANVSMSYGLLRNRQSSDEHARTHALGYVLGYQITPGLQLHSSLSDTYFLDARQNDLVRTTTFLVGLSKTLRGSPTWLVPSSSYKVEGRVFIDRNATGTHESDEAGLSGIAVQFDDGRKALTDAEGRFRFTGLKAGSYRVSLSLGQFRDRVRVTTMTSVPVELYERADARVDFGIVNFARVMGSVYNDYSHTGERRGDSPGLPNVTLIVARADDASERRLVTDGSGDYRIDDLAPGSYRLMVDPETIPPDFMGVAGPVEFEVKPISTTTLDVPMRALRSVVGHVYVSAPTANGQQGEPTMEPAAGVTVIAGKSESTTDATGRFVLRDLPAGDLVVTLKSQKPLAPNLVAPTGTIRLPKGAISIENAVIVIHNRGLLEYLKNE